jgi:hypothetical protein
LAGCFEVSPSFGHIEFQENLLAGELRADDVDGQTTFTDVMKDAAIARIIQHDIHGRRDKLPSVMAAVANHG